MSKNQTRGLLMIALFASVAALAAPVTAGPTDPVFATAEKGCEKVARFAIRDMGQTVGRALDDEDCEKAGRAGEWDDLPYCLRFFAPEYPGFPMGHNPCCEQWKRATGFPCPDTPW